MKILKKLLACIFFLGFGVATFFPILPLFYKAFVRFPKLEEAIVYIGTMSVVGEERCVRGRCSEPRYYGTDAEGKHEVFYGLPGCRRYPYSIANQKSSIGKYWFHSAFGVIQEDSVSPRNIKVFMSYDGSKKNMKKIFPIKKSF